MFAVLLLKYCFPTGDQLHRYCSSDIFTVAKPLTTVTFYLMAWLNKADDSVRHDVTAGLHYWQYWTKFLLYPRNGHIHTLTNIARITCVIQARKTLQ